MKRGLVCLLTLWSLAAFGLTRWAESADQFELRHRITDDGNLALFIESNLPDKAQVKISVDRTYEATMERTGKRDTYGENHFTYDGPLGQWKKWREVSLSPEAWKKKLLKHQKEMALTGIMAFSIDSISDKVEISAYVYANKTGERYGKREYESLLARIRNTELLAKRGMQVRIPIFQRIRLGGPSPFVAGNELKAGETYRLIKTETPLMPSRRFSDMSDLAGIRYLPSGTRIRVMDVVKISGNPWYKVSLPQFSQYSVKGGWINSIALLGSGVKRVSIVKQSLASLRAEVTEKIITPCLIAVVRVQGGVEGLKDEQAAQMIRSSQKKFWDETTEKVMEAMKGRSEDFKNRFYKMALSQCIASAQ